MINNMYFPPPNKYPKSSDGIRLSSIDSTPDDTHQKFYEICNIGGDATSSSNRDSEKLVVSIDQCYGSTSLFACLEDGQCDQFLPSLVNW